MGAMETQAVDLSHRLSLVASGLPVAPLLRRLELMPELWGEITARQEAPGSPHHDTRAIFLRWAKELTVDAVFRDLDAIDYPACQRLMPEAGALVTTLIDAIGDVSEIGRIMLVALEPGGTIDEHLDEGLYADHYDRFHVALSSEAGNLFFVDGAAVHMEPGQAWWFNHKRRHSVQNGSASWRLHLIADVVSPSHRALRGTYFQREFVFDLWDEMMPLLREHYQEVAHFKDIPLDPDVDRYNLTERSGNLRIFTARSKGELIGYAVFMVLPALHYKTSLQAYEDVIFLSPEHRNGHTGLKLLRFAHERLATEGVEVIYHHVKKAHPKLGAILQAMGFEHVDQIYGKRI